jgi:hypothetical protein
LRCGEQVGEVFIAEQVHNFNQRLVDELLEHQTEDKPRNHIGKHGYNLYHARPSRLFVNEIRKDIIKGHRNQKVDYPRLYRVPKGYFKELSFAGKLFEEGLKVVEESVEPDKLAIP